MRTIKPSWWLKIILMSEVGSSWGKRLNFQLNGDFRFPTHSPRVLLKCHCFPFRIGLTGMSTSQSFARSGALYTGAPVGTPVLRIFLTSETRHAALPPGRRKSGVALRVQRYFSSGSNWYRRRNPDPVPYHRLHDPHRSCAHRN